MSAGRGGAPGPELSAATVLQPQAMAMQRLAVDQPLFSSILPITQQRVSYPGQVHRI
jgi:hypothetical protein